MGHPLYRDRHIVPCRLFFVKTAGDRWFFPKPPVQSVDAFLSIFFINFLLKLFYLCSKYRFFSKKFDFNVLQYITSDGAVIFPLVNYLTNGYFCGAIFI